MNIEETLEFVQAAGWLGCKPGLERITELMHLLGNPQKQLRFVHITGTNGKGSTAAMLSSVLKRAGYITGLFTSPHLLRYNERIRINGIDISDRDLCTIAEIVKPAVERMQDVATEFERFTAMALVYFSQKKCDIVVLEVGLGGCLDSTNVIPTPEAAVITNIGLEHTEYLGDTLEKIATEKAGIIKPGTDVVLYGQSSKVERVVQSVCEDCGCRLTVTDMDQLHSRREDLSGQVLDYSMRTGLVLGLLGTYQQNNAAVVLDTVDVLRRRSWEIPEAAVKEGLAATRWPGRFEVLQQEPLVLVDGAHNTNGVENLAKSLRRYLPGRKLLFVMGVMADKDYRSMLDRIAPLAERFITVTPDSPRSLPSGELRREIQERLSLPVLDGTSVRVGLNLALETSFPEDAICVFGSLYQTGEVRAYFEKAWTQASLQGSTASAERTTHLKLPSPYGNGLHQFDADIYEMGL